jgi:WD repeat-containing protein 70
MLVRHSKLHLACLDGALHLWNTSSNYVRPNLSVESAHAKNTETGSVIFAQDGRTILTRGADDTVKCMSAVTLRTRPLISQSVWDTRKFKLPLVEKTGITTLYPGTNAIFSPDEHYVLTGTGWPQKGNKGRLLILRRETLEKVESVELDATVVKVVWHPRINQVSAQCTVSVFPRS